MNTNAIIAARNLDHVPVHCGLLRGPAESEKRSTFFLVFAFPGVVHNGEHRLPSELRCLNVRRLCPIVSGPHEPFARLHDVTQRIGVPIDKALSVAVLGKLVLSTSARFR